MTTPETTQIQYPHQKLVALMLKDQGIHEGIWMLSVSFGFAAVNSGPNEQEINPTAMAAITSIGIQRMPQMGPMCVDAAVANPRE